MTDNAELHTTTQLKISDRVRRKGLVGSVGTIKDIRTETTSVGTSNRALPLLVRVLWDNGTFSYFTPNALELA